MVAVGPLAPSYIVNFTFCPSTNVPKTVAQDFLIVDKQVVASVVGSDVTITFFQVEPFDLAAEFRRDAVHTGGEARKRAGNVPDCIKRHRGSAGLTGWT